MDMDCNEWRSFILDLLKTKELWPGKRCMKRRVKNGLSTKGNKIGNYAEK